MVTSSKEEIDILGENIGEKLEEVFEVHVQKLRNTRLVLNNIPENITNRKC
jgi:hypothetical protein